MRIIITGQTGTCKASFAKTLRQHQLQQHGLNPGVPAHQSECNKRCQWFELESCLDVDFRNFLTDFNEPSQARQWTKACAAILDQINAAAPQDCLLLLHSTFFRDGRFFSPISWDHLLLFEPDCIITLIDDIYDIWQRIERGPHDTHLSLEEIMTWRDFEISTAHSLACNLRLNPKTLFTKSTSIPRNLRSFFGGPIPHFVMSVKHSVETFRRLIFDRQTQPLVYASFPITRTRASQERRSDINSFRDRLCAAGAIVVDPLTIDELRMSIKNNAPWLKLRADDEFRKYHNTRWKIDNPTIPPLDGGGNPFAGLTDQQIMRVKDRIWNQVVERDFRMVGQCDRLIAYRPFYPESGNGRLGDPPLTSSDGVTRELSHALYLDKTVWAFHPKCDWCEQQEDSMFGERSLWSRVTRFPKKSDFSSLPGDDFTGFDELLSELKTATSRQK